MKVKPGTYHLIDLSPARREMPHFLDLFWWRHIIYGLLEVDVTIVRGFIQEYKERTGEALSFTGYLAFCLARVIDEDKSVQGLWKGNRQLAVFDDVDVALPIERRVDGKRVPTSHIIRRANHKTYLEIHQEIRSAQAQTVPPSKGFAPWLRAGMLLPGPLAGVFVAIVRLANRLDPSITAAVAGTVGVTAVGMFNHGHGAGWGLTPPAHSLGLVVGGIARKPAVVGDRIEARDILHLTIGFDHDVVDGGPAARFVQRLTEMIEGGYGLAEFEQAVPADLNLREDAHAGL
jgi:pyruvate/2-oxoglutarate dehydrogenase complex dihydrolipoamide acyltransferase (E2) component